MQGEEDREKDEDESQGESLPETTEMARLLELSAGTVRKMKSSGALRKGSPEDEEE